MLEHQMKQVAFYNRVFLSIVEGYFGFFSDGPGVETGESKHTEPFLNQVDAVQC